MLRFIITLYIIVSLISIGFTFIDPNYSGYMDFRYSYSSLNHPHTGTLQIGDTSIGLDLMLKKNYHIVYETTLSENIESYSVLYLSFDHIMGYPWSFKLGRFRVPFGTDHIQPPDRLFISESVMKDVYWGTSYLLPHEETGLNLSYRDPDISADFYVVNGNGAYRETLNNHEGKSFGIDFRFPVRRVLVIGASCYYNDMSNSVNFGANNSYFLLGNDYRLSLFDVNLALAVYLASGRLNGASQDANGVKAELSFPLYENVTIGTQASLININSLNYYRAIGLIKQVLADDLALRYEFVYDKVQAKKNVQLQVQLLVNF